MDDQIQWDDAPDAITWDDAPGPLAQLAQKAPSAAPLIGAAEGAASFGTSLAAPLVGGLAGLGTEAANLLGLTDKTGGDVSNAVSDALTYHPETQGGQAASDILSTPFRKLQEVGNAAAERILDAKPVDLDKVPDALKAPAYLYNKAAGSPEFATAATTAVQMLPTLLGGGEAKVKAVEHLADVPKPVGALEATRPDLLTPDELQGPDSPLYAKPQERLKELRVQRKEGLTPDEHAEYTDLLEKDAFQGKVKGNGAYIEGTGNSDALNHYHDAETVPQVKLDLDNFKPVNDALGHPAGDVLIQHTGEELAKEFPPDADGKPSVYHHGGDEFTIIPKPDETLADVQKRVETVREQIKNTPVELTDTKGDTSVHPGVDFSLGAGEGHAAASDSLTRDKADREASGIRRPRYNRSTDTPGAEQGTADSVPARAERPASQVDVQDAGAIQQRVVPVADEWPSTEVQNRSSTSVPSDNTGASRPISENDRTAGNASGTEVRNTAVNAQREALNLDAIPQAEREHWQAPEAAAREKIAQDPNWPRAVSAEVAAKPRALTTTETMGLAHDLKGLTAEHAKATQDVLKAREAGDVTGEAQALLRQHAAVDAMEQNHSALREGGTHAARGLAIRNAILKDDYTIGRNMDRTKASFGENFNDAIKKQVEDLTNRLAKAEETIAEQAKAKQPRQAKAKLSIDERKQAQVKNKIADLQARIEKRLKACPL